MSDEFKKNLMGPEPTLLPEEPDVMRGLSECKSARELVAKTPTSSLLWALLSDEAFTRGQPLESYAFARTGYHRGLDALRRNGWRGAGPIPWDHEPNQGFLRSLYALGRAARAIVEDDEAERVDKFLDDSDPSARAHLEP